MSIISVNGLTFAYDGSYDNIFENVSFSIDTDWKLGFIGRNGKGKTTFLKLLTNQYEYKGKISASVLFDYFPFAINNPNLDSYTIASQINADFEEWKLDRETSLLGMDPMILLRPFETLSKGEQTKILLAILFSKENNFLLIDEPTNHLDLESRNVVAKYLNNKKGFILVSHDRHFLDLCIDHVLSINRTNIEIQKGDFSSWWENKQNQDKFELTENNRLQEDIERLRDSARNTARWAGIGHSNAHRDGSSDSRTIGFKGSQQRGAAKLDKAAKRLIASKEKAIEMKSRLLKNVEIAENLQLNQLNSRDGIIAEVSNLSIYYGEQQVTKDINFVVEMGARVQLKGVNGCGKSSVIKLILGEKINHTGRITLPQNLQISYVSQDTSFLRGSLRDFEMDNNLDPTAFRSMLTRLDFSRIQFEKPIENFSEGQKKKLLIARSLCKEADLYIWDEPLNHIDIISRMQIENLVLTAQPTMIFVEHDELFSEKIATDIVQLSPSTILNNKGYDYER